MRFSVTGQVARESSRPRVLSPEVMSPETWVMLPEILVMSPEKNKSNYMIDFYVAKVFMALLGTKKKFLKLTKCPWVRNEYIPNEQRFIFLLETENVSLCC